jgi:capsular polysaccharide export protein
VPVLWSVANRPPVSKKVDMNVTAASLPSVAVLFLQGPPSPFARELGAKLASRDVPVYRINLCIGDWLYWHDARAQSYRGGLAGWEAFLTDVVTRNGITDIVYFADRFPYHRVAQKVARLLGIRAISYEYGYLRPDWIIVERGGQSAQSHVPDDLARFRAVAAGLPAPDLTPRYSYPSFPESAGDVIYHYSNYLFWFLYPRFVRDRVYNPVLEYASYNLRFLRARLNRKRAAQIVAELETAKAPFFVVPLQMQNDYQVRKNSAFTDQRRFLDVVLASFRTHAAPDAKLVIKVHPLDNGIENWRAYLRRAARDLGDRVIYLDGGDLGRLCRTAAGMITLNSTSGMQALQWHCPLKVLGIAVFDIAGLTHAGPLDSFWQDPFRPHPDDVTAFITGMAHCVHVRGNFYSPQGRAAAAHAIADLLVAGQVNGALFTDPPPRLARARAEGIAVDD